MAFLRFPAELVAHVGSFLETQDLLEFRLTCRQFYQQSKPIFAATFFSTVTIDLCPGSLQRLQRIAQDNILRRHVRTVVLAWRSRPYLPSDPCCPKLWNHFPGTGHHWIRDPVSHCLDPNPASNPAISLLRTALAALPNLLCLTISDDFGPEHRPVIPPPTGPLLLDGVHIALLCAADLPLRSLRMTYGDVAHITAHALLPRSVLSSITPSWATYLVELEIAVYPAHTDAAEAEQAAIFAALVRRAHALRRLVVHQAKREFYDMLMEANTETPLLPRLEVLDMRGLRPVPPDVLREFVLRFRDSLRHLCVRWVTVEAAGGLGWRRVLAGWAAGVGRLQSFNVRDLREENSTYRPGKVVFDGIAKWAGSEGVPEKGTVEFAAGGVGSRKEAVTGLRFVCARGCPEGDVQSVLGKLAEIARVEVRAVANGAQVSDMDTEWITVERRFVIGGKLEANLSMMYQSPGLEAI